MSDARIFDRGYRHYEGSRRGVRGAMLSLGRHSIQRALGLRRPFGAKVFPILAVAIAFIPAIVFVGIAAFVPDDSITDDFLPTYGEYYGFVTSAILIFSAFVAPEVLCPDRRNGMLGLYLASPLTRDTYLVAKAASVLAVLALATTGPPLLMLVANTLQGNGPDGPDDFVVLLIRVVAAGLAVSIAHTAVSLAVSSLTDRKAFASAGVIVLLIASSIVAAVLYENADAPVWVWGLNLIAMPFHLVQRIYGEHEPTDDISQMTVAAVVLANVLWVAASAAVVRWRYQRVVVTK